MPNSLIFHPDYKVLTFTSKDLNLPLLQSKLEKIEKARWFLPGETPAVNHLIEATEFFEDGSGVPQEVNIYMEDGRKPHDLFTIARLVNYLSLFALKPLSVEVIVKEHFCEFQLLKYTAQPVYVHF